MDTYSRKKHATKNQSECEFCKYVDSGSYLKKYSHFFLISNIYPYEENHLLLLPVRHINTELDFTHEEDLELLSLHKKILKAFYTHFDMCFYLTRENTPDQSMWHWHRHYMPTDKVLRTGIQRVAYTGIDINVDLL